ncbi:MAG TPA: hypothetical protein VKU37_13570 [Verrucomicrobiae bacterium]|nr:hypothetical protein [Verrucomicrobiae bacterium]
MIAIAMICLAGQFAFGGLAGTPAVQPNPPANLSSNSLPAKITTTDGKTYNAVRLVKVEPDGLLVEYRPEAGGLGVMTLKFARLPEPLQKQFGYDPRKASDYEHEQKLAAFALAQKLRQDEKARTAASMEESERPNLSGTVSVNSSDPTVTYTYYAPGEKPDSLGSNIATCQHACQCRADFDAHLEPRTVGQPARFYIDAVRITLGLNCQIIEPKSPFDYIRLHEERRRKIFEYFYQFGPQVAKSIGDSMIGQEFTSSDTDMEAAKAGAMAQAQAVVEGQYLVHLDSVAVEADQYYEKLSDYSQNNLDSDQIVQQAIAKYANQIDTRPQAPVGAPSFPDHQFVPRSFPPPFPPSPN